MNLYQHGKQFVSLVQKNDVLWNKRNIHFKNSDLRSQTWAQIGNVFGLSGEQAAQAFVSLRQKYIREKEKEKKSESTGIKLKKKWFLIDVMRFLDEVIQQRRTHLSLSYVPSDIYEGSSNSLNLEPEEKMLEDLQIPIETYPDPLFIKVEPQPDLQLTDVEISNSPISTPTPQPQPPSPTPGTSKSASPELEPEPEPEPEPEIEVNKKEVIPKKRKARETDLAALIAAVKAPVKIQHEDNWDVKDEVKMFCKFLGTRLDKLPDDVRLRLENEVMGKLFQVESSLV